jgi:hypothetical protein
MIALRSRGVAASECTPIEHIHPPRRDGTFRDHAAQNAQHDLSSEFVIMFAAHDVLPRNNATHDRQTGN